MTLFNRNYEIIIGKPGQDGFLVKELDVSFTVKKTQESDKNQNKLSLKIYNLSKEHKNTLVSKDNLVVIIQAGYGENMSTIFQGKITKCTHKKDGQNFVTEIEAGDGYIALRESKSSLSFPPKCNALDIVNALCSELIKNDPDVAMGTIYNQEILKRKVYTHGYSCVGMTKSLLTKVLSPLNMNFSMQNEIIFIGSIPHKTQQVEVFLLTKETGLINSPQKLKNDPESLKKEDKPKDGVTFECLLNGVLNPMSMVKIKSEDIDGLYKIVESEHSGEFLGEKWDTKCTAVEIK